MRRGQTLAYILHDAALDTDPELVQAAGQAVVLALENGRLEADLQSKTAELLLSSGRVAAAGAAERRKLERELHDGAQQRLLTIQIKLALLRERLDNPDLAAALEQIGDDATVAAEELRNLAHGIYPVDLREGGIGEGLRSCARSAPVPIHVVDDGLGRCAPEVEAAVYFCSLEAIQNAVKHAGRGARVRVTLERVGETVQFSVDDDGVGFAPGEVGEGIGLLSMRERIGDIGGELEIDTSPGGGTVSGGSYRHTPGQPAAGLN